MDKTEWLKEKRYCASCGKLLTEYFGTGKYCSRSCANKRIKTTEDKQKIKQGMKNSKKWNSYLNNLSNGKGFKSSVSYSGYYKGVFCASTWELAYYLYCINENINIVRCKDYFSYIVDNEVHMYLPDWYLPDLNKYIEIKGKILSNKIYKEKIVKAKAEAMKQYDLNYEIIDDNKIDFYLKYCKNKYNTEKLQTLYDDEILIQKESRKHNSRTKNYIWINNKSENTLIPKNKLNHYLNLGWFEGRIKTENMLKAWESQKHKYNKNVKQNKKSHIYTNEFRKGKKQLFKEDEHIFVLPEEVQNYIKEGWKLGTGHKQKSTHHSGGNHKNLNRKEI